MKWNGFLIGLLLVVCTSNAQLQGRFDEKINLSSFPFTLSFYGTQYGLAQSEISALTQIPASKVLLFSTFDGLYTFDGYTFEKYLAVEQFKNFIFKDFYVSKKINLIYGLRGDDLFQLYPKVAYYGKYKALSLQEETILTIDSVGQIQKNKKNFAKLPSTAKFDYDIEIIQEWQNQFLLGDHSQLFIFNPKTKKVAKIFKEHINRIKQKSPTELYLLTENAVWILNSKLELRQLLGKGLEKPNFKDFISIGTQTLFTSFSGLYIYNSITHKTEIYNNDGVLPTNILNYILYDEPSECIFIGTGNKGLLKLQLKTAISIYEKNTDFSRSFASIIPDKKGGFFSACGQTMVQFKNNQIVNSYTYSSSIASLSVVDNAIYAGTWDDGIIKIGFDGKPEKYFKEEKNNFHAVYQDEAKAFWIGYTFGIRTGSSIATAIPFAPKIIKGQVVTFFESKSKELFVGGTEGFYIISKDRKRVKQFDKKRVKNIAEVRSFLEDKEGTIWIGTYGEGLLYYKNGRLFSLKNKKNYLLGDDIFSLALDKYNQVLITSNRGLRIISLKKIQSFATGKSETLIPFYINETKGIFNMEFNGGFLNNYATTDSLNFYFPTLQGVVHYRSKPFLNVMQPLAINRIEADGKIVDKTHLLLDRNTKQIKFSFACTNFTDFQNVYYQYKIVKKGEDKEWSLPSRETEISFINSGYGTYLFSVRAISPYLEGKIQNCTFEIKPYFYETLWFFSVMILIFISSTIVIVRYRYIRLRKEAQFKIETKMMVKELELKAIHSQMNPHFVFNSLQHINYLIMKGRFKDAENLVVDFSKLMRIILNKSDKIFLLLSEELVFLKLYLNIQKSRFEDVLIYSIQVSEGLENYWIPSMILQPLIENAIVHGIAHKLKGNGLIIIVMVLKEKKLHIEITDNGIGRKASKIINNNKSYPSSGYSIFEKKIELLQKTHGVNVVYEIQDIENELETGTKVILIIDQYDPLHTN